MTAGAMAMIGLDSLSAVMMGLAAAFTGPSWANMQRLMVAWIGLMGSRTVTRLVQCPLATRIGKPKHFSTFHRFFSRARWSLDDVGRCLVRMIEPWLPEGPVRLIVDDTLCR